MTGPRVADAAADAAALTAAGVPTFTDPAAAAANLPCVLILPPVVRWPHLAGSPAIDWRLAVLADGPPGLEAWDQLDGLLELLAARVALVSAEPAAYTLAGDKSPVPAYLCTVTE